VVVDGEVEGCAVAGGAVGWEEEELRDSEAGREFHWGDGL
jgi:hypothetical protein